MVAIRSFYKRLLRGDPLGAKSWLSTSENDFRRAGAFILSFVMLGMLSLTLLLNWYEGNPALLAPLAVTAVVPAVALFWLFRKPSNPTGPLLALLVSLMILGFVLLISGGAPRHESLVWFVVFPPLVMFSSGLRYGSALFLSFYGGLCLLMLTPFDRLLADPMAMSLRLRFLLAMLGTFVFSWFAEYMRHHTRNALVKAVNQLEQDALTDPLTGLGNRRDFQNYFSWVSGKAARDQKPFSIAMIDIDHFKNVNDTFGHEVGDRVLVHVSGVITGQMRAMDRLFRWGGEEFLLLMPGTDSSEAAQAVERVRKSVALAPYVYDDITLSVTVSIGLYSGGNPDAEVNEQIAGADKNLYAAKSSGRNTVVS